MRVVLGFLLYLGALVMLAGAFAEPVWTFAQSIGVSMPPFHKWVYRSLKIYGLLLAIAWLLVTLPRSAWLDAAGLSAKPTTAFSDFIRGAAYGFAMLAIVVIGLWAVGARQWSGLADETVVDLLVSAVVLGLLVALIEELWFRGFLFGALAARSPARPWPTMLCITGLYGLGHFVRADTPVSGSVEWLTGFKVLADCFDRFSDPSNITALIALCAAGWLLIDIRRRSGSVWMPIGIHAGWVCSIYLSRKLSRFHAEHPQSFWASGYDGVIGPLATAIFFVAYWLIVLRQGKRDRVNRIE